MTGPLRGFRVLDLTNVLAGPFAGYQLALLGADVIKIEIPRAGDLARQLGADPGLNTRRLGVSFLAQNGGKRSLTVNLKAPEGKEIFERLVGKADVVLENFRPGVLARLGFGWPRLRELNPLLVYCAISGFGASGPMRDRPAYDQVIQGLAGMMSVTGTPESGPIRAGYPIADTLGGMTAAFAVAAALAGRQQTGEGAYIDVSMLESAITALGWAVSNYLIADVPPRQMGNENMTSAPSGAFRTLDGMLNIAANKQEQFEILCKQLGLAELITDPRFAHREDRKRNRAQLRRELERSLMSAPAQHWEEILSAAGVPAARVLSVPDALDLPQLAVRDFLHDVGLPGGERKVRVLGQAFQVDGQSAVPGSAPRLGEHTDDVLTELGYRPDRIEQLRSEGVV